MKIAHLILAHTDPQQLERLVKHLLYKDDVVYIHLDRKAPFAQFELLQQYTNVHFIKKRTVVKWGSYSIVEATINSFREILNDGKEYGFINLLSGHDYPLQPLTELHSLLNDYPDKAFMSFSPLFDEWQEAIPRITHYHLNNYPFPGRYLAQKLLNTLFTNRKFPDSLIPVGRSQWFTASVAIVHFIVDYWDTHTRFRRFIKFTWAPDEFVFQTILYNSPYRQNMVNDNLRYTDWSEGNPSPKTLTLNDKEALLSSGAYFARKFNLQTDVDIMNAIDEKLNTSEPSLPA